jgi:hypothetical protein
VRWVALLVLVACRHEPEVAPLDKDVVAGELVVGMPEGSSADAVLSALQLDGYKFDYVAAATETTHLVKVSASDGTPLDAAGTAAVKKQLADRAGLRFVELNRVRQPR